MGGSAKRTWHPPAGGRLMLFFAVRYLTPVVVFAALSASPDIEVEAATVGALLTAAVGFALVCQALCARRRALAPRLLWSSIVFNIAIVTALVALAGGPGGPLTFLYTIEALAAGILLSSFVGMRVLVMSSVALVALDVARAQGVLGEPADLPRGLEALVALWIVGGGATLFSAFNERELRRRNAELATIRQVTLDIENTLSLERILGDLTRGVVECFAFDGALVLTPVDGSLRIASAFGVTGATDRDVEIRGPLSRALEEGKPLTVDAQEARRDGALSDVLGARGYVAVPLASDGLLIATRTGRKRRAAVVRSHEIEALGGLAHHAALAIANARLHEHVSALAVTDALTGLPNHGEFQRRLHEELGRLARYAGWRAPGRRVSLLMIDVDHFKDVNDRFGHLAGDRVLQEIAGIMRGAVRGFDILARYGGEEFAVVLPETDAVGARQASERLLRAIAEHDFAHPDGAGEPVRIGVSIGIATAPEDGLLPAALVAAADGALYRSKAAGRNRATHASAGGRRMANVVTLDEEVTRRRQGRGERPAGGASRRARGQSSRPKRRTPPS